VDHISLQSRGKNKKKIEMSILYTNEDNSVRYLANGHTNGCGNYKTRKPTYR